MSTDKVTKLYEKEQNLRSTDCPVCQTTLNGSHIKPGTRMGTLDDIGYPRSAYGGNVQGVVRLKCPGCAREYHGFLKRHKFKSEYDVFDMAPVADIKVQVLGAKSAQEEPVQNDRFVTITEDTLLSLEQLSALTTAQRREIPYNQLKAIVKNLGHELPKSIKFPDLQDMVEEIVRLKGDAPTKAEDFIDAAAEIAAQDAITPADDEDTL